MTAADKILESNPPTTSDKFWCQHCMADRYIKDRVMKTLVKHGRTQRLARCRFCKAK